jgi:ubiquitin C-terminal hydrolase
MTIGEVPNVLVLHLKRFSFENMFAKVTKHIQFPLQLQLSYQPITQYHPEGITGKGSARQQQSVNVGYQLTGVVVHHGYSINSGHYIAYVQVKSTFFCRWSMS